MAPTADPLVLKTMLRLFGPNIQFRADDGSMAKGAGASALVAFAHEHKLLIEEDG